MQHSKDGLFVTDHTGKVVMANQAYMEMFEVDSSEVLGRNVADLVEKGLWKPNLFKKVVENKQTISVIQTSHRNKNILSTGIPIFDLDQKLRFVIFNDRDISILNRMLESLEKEEHKDGWLRFELTNSGLIQSEIKDIVAHSSAMLNVLKMVVRVSTFDIPLLLMGESGVGKTLIARLVHRLSERRNGTFLDLNCGAIPENLLESELFGHEPGSFSGASSRGKRGLFEMADNGTLFLDEISEIPLHLQVKILKFIDTSEMIRVGGVRPIKINTRILSASNRDLKEMVQKGLFREDLFFRLNVIPIQIPPLRERKEDIIPLTNCFIKLFGKEFNRPKTISKAALNALCEYNFPGNVRELENLVKRLVTMTDENYIRIKHLPEILQNLHASDAKVESDHQVSYQKAMASFERKIIKDAIRKYGSQRKAAQALGLNQSTLSRKLKG
jgi:PAS domain S-box-containing protein